MALMTLLVKLGSKRSEPEEDWAAAIVMVMGMRG